MENLPKRKRGRPKKIPDSLPGIPGLELPSLLEQTPGVQGLFDWSQSTGRHRANLFYADRAREPVKEMSKNMSIPEDPVLTARLRTGIDWILERSTVLSELGRLMVENPTDQDVERFQRVVWHIAEKHQKMTARGAAAYARRIRLGETRRRDRVATLHHDLNKAINEHRQRYPETTWEDVQKALGHTVQQVSRKVRPTAP